MKRSAKAASPPIGEVGALGDDQQAVEIRNLETWQKTLPKQGRPPRPVRTVIQIRKRKDGKVSSFASLTIDRHPSDVMRDLQELYRDHSKFQRATDDPRWAEAEGRGA